MYTHVYTHMHTIVHAIVVFTGRLADIDCAVGRTQSVLAVHWFAAGGLSGRMLPRAVV